mgnify:FL=1
MGASPGQFVPADGCAASPARVAPTSIDPGLAAVVAVHTLEVAKVTERGATGSDADREHVHESLSQVFELLQAECLSWREWLNASDKQAFIGIDVADTRYE